MKKKPTPNKRFVRTLDILTVFGVLFMVLLPVVKYLLS